MVFDESTNVTSWMPSADYEAPIFCTTCQELEKAMENITQVLGMLYEACMLYACLQKLSQY
jgi:hypothetical protein